jgi:hypothetical protein
VRLREPKLDYCGWCARKTESGIYRRADPETVPFPDCPGDARAVIARFRRVVMPGTDYVTTPHRRIWLDRISDSDAVFVAGEFRRMEAAAMALRTANRPTRPRRG